MPKSYRDTRRAKAEELFQRLQRGPEFSKLTFSCSNSLRPPHEVAMEHCRLWLDSWVIHEVCKLVPELKEKLDELGNIRPGLRNY